MPTPVQPRPSAPQAVVITVPATEGHKVFLSVKEMAAALGLCEGTIWAHMRRGEMPSVKYGRRRLIPAAFLAQLAREAME